MDPICLTDEFCLTGGDFVVGAGIIISAGLAIWSLVWSSKLQGKQNDLTEEHNQLAADQNRLAEDQNRLAEEQNALLAEQNDLARRQAETHSQPASQYPLHYPPQPAAFRVTLTPSGRSQRIVIRNTGGTPAHDVHLEVDPPSDLVGGSPQTFPRLDPGQDWRLLFARSLGSPSRYQWSITWETPTGETKSQDGWVSPP